MKVPVDERAYRSMLSGDGMPGPIEERMGRRLLRLVPPDSSEGIDLFRAARVELIGPDSRSLGRVRLDEAVRQLRERLERRLEDPELAPERAALREGLSRLVGRANDSRDH